MPLASGPFLAAALLLAVGGVAKLRRPDATAEALRTLGLRRSPILLRGTVRLVAAMEVAVGLGAVLAGGRLAAWLVASSYAAFGAFVLVAWARGGAVSSCGCFGTPDTPPTSSHLLVTTAAMVAALGAVVDPLEPALSGLGDQPLAGLPFLALTGCCVWFAFAALAILPRLSAEVTAGEGA